MPNLPSGTVWQRGVGVRAPNDADGDFRGGIAGQLDAAIVGRALDEVEAGLTDAARLGAGKFDQRRVVADERIVGVHDHGINRTDGIPPSGPDAAAAAQAKATDPAVGPALVSSAGLGPYGVVKLAVIEHLAPKTAINEAAGVFDELAVKYREKSAGRFSRHQWWR